MYKRQLQGQDVVVNLVGPYYLFGTTVLEAAIQKGVNYVDIVDDFDTAAQLLELNDKAAGALSLIHIFWLLAVGQGKNIYNKWNI